MFYFFQLELLGIKMGIFCEEKFRVENNFRQNEQGIPLHHDTTIWCPGLGMSGCEILYLNVYTILFARPLCFLFKIQFLSSNVHLLQFYVRM